MLSLQHIFSSCGRWNSVHSKFVDFPPQVIQASANVSHPIEILQAFLKERQIWSDKSAITNNNYDVRQLFFYRRKSDINIFMFLFHASKHAGHESTINYTVILVAKTGTVTFHTTRSPLRSFHWNRTCTEIFVKLCLLIVYIVGTEILK